MTRRRLSDFLDAIAAGRRPKRFRAEPDDAEVLRTAIVLRAARTGESAPTEAFVEGLFQRLSEQAKPQTTTKLRPVPTHRARIALAAAAAAAVLVAGTTVATENLHHPAPTSATARIPQGSELRTGTFQTDAGKVLGQIVAYRGQPSWVFMNVDIPNYNGRIDCMLQVDNGGTVAFGTFTVHGGTGQFSKAIDNVDVGRLRGAKLVTSTGSPMAAATFAAAR
jgi:hypothetical protein